MSRASALAERQVQLNEFYGHTAAKVQHSKVSSPHRVLGNDEQDTRGKNEAYRAEELFIPPLPVSPVISYDDTSRARAAIAGRDSAAYSYPYETVQYVPEPPAYYPAQWTDTNLYVEQKPALRSRLGLPGKRLPLFLVLALMAIGLVVAITPVLARGKTAVAVRQSRLALSGYGNGSSVTTQGDTSGDVPVIDVTSKPPTTDDGAVVKSEIVSPNSGSALLGAPSISVAGIEAVLNKYGSPAAGKGQALYDLGVKYGINPAYALAFFVHESGCGTKGVARFTNSLGNIRTTAGYADYEGYRKYPSWEAGMEDWYKLISDQYVKQWGLRTLEAIIPVYAPWGDNNNPPTYIASVNGMVDSWRGK